MAKNLEGPEVTKTLAALVPSLAPEAQELLLRALGARGDAAALPAVVSALESSSEGVRIAAYEAVAAVGDSSVVERLVNAAATKTGREQQAARASLHALTASGVNRAIAQGLAGGEAAVRVERIRALAIRRAERACGALLRLAAEEGDDFVRREAIGAALPGAPAAAKSFLLRLLGRAPTAEALRAVRASLDDGDASVRDTALRTIAAWPDASPAAELLRLARTLDKAEQRAIALAGYMRMAARSSDPQAMYREALKLAATREERSVVLAGLGAAGTKEALSLVEEYLNDGDREVQAEAVRAAVRLADSIRGSDVGRARAALDRILFAVAEAKLRQLAQEVINDMEKLDDHILAWRVAGPYQEKGKDGGAIFDAALPPEKPEFDEAAWKPLRQGVGSWEIDLEHQLGQVDHCAAYLRTRIESPVDQDARLELGSDDSIKAWLNGALVHSNKTNRGLSARQDIVAVKLRKGWNDLTLKVVDNSGCWAFCCRVRKPDGSALPGLKVEAK